MMMLSMVMMCISLSFYAWLTVVRCMRVRFRHGLGWVSYLVGCVGSGSLKWTHGQLWAELCL